MHRSWERARPGVAIAVLIGVLAMLTGAVPAAAKTTKKARKAKVTTTKASKRPAPTTAKRAPSTADQGPPKSIVGTEVGPGDPIKIGIIGGAASEAGGDVQRSYLIALDTARREGVLPVHGRDVVPYWRAINLADPTSVRAACTAAAQDDKVFAALIYVSSAECLGLEYKIPAIGGSMTNEAMNRAFPYAFSVFQSLDAPMANFAPWADSLGLLKGKKLGMFHSITAGRQDQVNTYFKPQLKKLGYELAVEAAGGADEAGDRVAVQRFKAAGVDTVFLSYRFGEIGRAARAQGYRPKFVIGAPEGAVICDGCPATAGLTKEMFDGVYSMATLKVGENGVGGNPQPDKSAVECAQNYEKHAGERARQIGTPFEQTRWQSIQWGCVEVAVLLTALKAAGPKLTQGAFVNAMETAVKGVRSGFFTDITYTRTNHHGGTELRTLQLDGDCLCWKVKSPLRPLFVTS